MQVTFKGKRTIIFNAVMAALAAGASETSPELATEWQAVFTAVLALGNMYMRAITDTPINQAVAKAEVTNNTWNIERTPSGAIPDVKDEATKIEMKTVVEKPS